MKKKKGQKEKIKWEEYTCVDTLVEAESACCYATVDIMRKIKNDPERYVVTRCQTCGQECELVGDR